MAKWIVVEGGEGCGKTHAIELMKTKLESYGYNVIVTKGIGTGEIGKVVREQVIHNKVKNNTRAFFVFSAHLDNYNEVMKHIKKKDTVIITDRYLITFFAYNYLVNADIGSDRIVKYFFNDFLFSKKPTYTLFIDTKPEIARERAIARKDANSIDKKDLTFYTRIRNSFLYFFNDNKNNHKKAIYSSTVDTTTIVNNSSLNSFERKIKAYISERFSYLGLE